MDYQYNSVPGGRAGTGAAYILPDESKALDAYIGNIEEQRRAEQVNELAKRKAMASVNKSYDDNAIKVLPGQLYGAEMNSLIQKHIEQGAKLRQQGFDVYHPDPNRPDQVAASSQYMKDRATLDQIMEHRKQLEANVYRPGLTSINDPEKQGKFEEDSINTFKSFFADNPNGDRLQKSFFGKETAPGLEKAWLEGDFNKAIKPETIKTVTNDGFNRIEKVLPNEPGIRQQVQSNLLSDPTSLKMLNKNGVDTSFIKGTKDRDGILKDVDAFYNTPEGQKILKTKGIEYNTPEYWKSAKQLADQKAQKSLDTFNTIRENLVKNNAAKVAQMHGSQKEYEGLNYALRLRGEARDDERLRMAKSKYAKDEDAQKVFAEPEINSLRVSSSGDGSTPTHPKVSYSTFTTAWQPVKGEGIAFDLPNYETIGLKGELTQSKTGNISRMRLVQVGQVAKFNGKFVNDETLSMHADDMRDYVKKHPEAIRFPINGGSIPIPKNRSEINSIYIYNKLPKSGVAVLYNDQDIKDGVLRQNAKPIMVPLRQVESKLKPNKLAAPKNDFLNLNGGEKDDFGLFD
jgi:hypothetical protein